MNSLAEVKNKSKDQLDCLRALHSFPIQAHLGDNSIGELFLSMRQKRMDMRSWHWARTASLCPESMLNFSFVSPHLFYPLQKQAATNDSGVVKLGHLTGIVRFTAIMELTHSVMKTWTLPEQMAVLVPQTSVDTIEGEDVETAVPLLQGD